MIRSWPATAYIMPTPKGPSKEKLIVTYRPNQTMPIPQKGDTLAFQPVHLANWLEKIGALHAADVLRNGFYCDGFAREVSLTFWD